MAGFVKACPIEQRVWITPPVRPSFSKLKAENRPDTDYANQEDLIQAIEEWIDYYNHRLDVFKYLETLFSAFIKRETPEIEAYLPWAREIQESCKA